MSLVIDATAQSPASRVNSPASLRRRGLRVRRSVSRMGMAQAVPRPCASSILYEWAFVGRYEKRRWLGHLLGMPRSAVPANLFSRSLGCCRLYRDVGAAVALGGELDAAFGGRKQRVVRAHADV